MTSVGETRREGFAGLRNAWSRALTHPRAPWIAGALLAAWQFLYLAVISRSELLVRFDDGIEFSSVTYLLHGQLPITDFYEPYGIGLGIPGALASLFGLGGGFDLRLIYALFPPLATMLAVVFVWRRCGPTLALLVGFVGLVSGVARYSMGWAALFGALLLVDRAARATPERSLAGAAANRPRALLAAAAVLSLAGWARTEYVSFGVLWALMLLIALPRGPSRRKLVGATLLLALLPVLIVVLTGGLQHLWWFVTYSLSGAPSGFHAQRGHVIEWHYIWDRIRELWHLQLGSGAPGLVVGSYGVALATLIAALALLTTRSGRDRLLRRDRTFVLPFLLLICAAVLYAQVARFSEGYGKLGNPVFWAAAALLVGQLGAGALLASALILAYPVAAVVSPGAVENVWSTRPPVRDRVAVPGLNRLPLLDSDNGAPSMAALVVQWRRLGLRGRSTLSVNRHNDIAWGNDAIVPFLLDAPPAAWSLTYDPGLVNTDAVQRETVSDLCRDRAPIVQLSGDYPYPAGPPVYVGSRRLDEFLAVDYRVRAIAGFYRILMPATPRCVLPGSLDSATLARLRDRYVVAGEMPEAGALAIARIDRAKAGGTPPDPDDVAIAALGGYRLGSSELPARPLRDALRTDGDGQARPGLAAAAATPWPTAPERLAAQSAWIAHRVAGEPQSAAATAAVRALALAHPDWPAAIGNLDGVVLPSPALFARLAATGAAGLPEFDIWRRTAYFDLGDLHDGIEAGLAVVADDLRRDDPVGAGQAEMILAKMPGMPPGCALELERRAALRPGIRVPALGGSGVPCPQPEMANPAVL